MTDTISDPRGTQRDIVIAQGKTFLLDVRWEGEDFIYKAITAIDKSAPARITVPGHGLTDGWRVVVVSVVGMKQINAPCAPLRDKDFVRATVVDADTIELNAVNAAGFADYKSGGYVQFYTPKSLAGCQARMTIRGPDGTALAELTSSPPAGIALDDAAKVITARVEATAAAAMAAVVGGAHDLEIEDADGVVTGLLYGSVTVKKEETT